MTDSLPTPSGWTCFHCGETFLTESSARTHFGETEESLPACRIKAGAERSVMVALRRVEAENTALRRDLAEENTESARAYWSQQTRHQHQLTAAEELGYERGLAAGSAPDYVFALYGVGSCRCLTKTPYPSLHDSACPYRVLSELLFPTHN